LENGVSIVNERLVASYPLERCTLELAIRSILRADEAKLAAPPARVLVRGNTSDKPLVVHISPLRVSCGSPVERIRRAVTTAKPYFSGDFQVSGAQSEDMDNRMKALVAAPWARPDALLSWDLMTRLIVAGKCRDKMR
jgi:hypothetical protein